MRYDFADQRKIPRIGENRTEDYARSLLRRAHESRIRPCCIIPLRDLMFCAESGIDPLSPQGTHERLIRLDGYDRTARLRDSEDPAAPMRSAASVP